MLGQHWRIAPLLTITIAVVVAVFVIVITVLDIRRTETIFWQELEARGHLLTDQLNGLLSDYLYFRDIMELDKVSGIVSQHPDIKYVQVFDADGRLLVHSGLGRLPVGVSVEEFGRRSLESGQNLVRVNNGVMEIASPIAVGGQPLGGVWISLGSEALQAQIRAIIIEHSLQGLALMVAGAAVSYFIARQLTRPVKMLVDATNEIASGQLEARVQGVRGGELVELAGSFNRMAEQLQARVQDLQESRARIVTVQEGVRRDMAAHLHGRVQGRLLVLRANLEQVAAQDLPEVARCSLREVLEQMDQVIHDELSGVSRRLYPSILRRGLGPALGSLCDQFESSFSLELEVDQGLVKLERSDRNFVPEPVRLAAYRISEESLTNIVKHAGATRVEVRVSLRAGDTLCLTIEDNGRGFDVDAAASGLGMAAIMDYAGAVGGECIVRSAPGAGTAVTATFLVAGLVTGLAATPGAEPQEKVSPWE